jgi:hypothetical protein
VKCDWTSSRCDGPLHETGSLTQRGLVTVVDDLASPGRALEVGVDLGLDELGQEPPGRVPEVVVWVVQDAEGWAGDRQGSRPSHGGVFFGQFGRSVILRFTRDTPPSSTSGHSSIDERMVIPRLPLCDSQPVLFVLDGMMHY